MGKGGCSIFGDSLSYAGWVRLYAPCILARRYCRKRLPMHLTVKEEIEWGEFDNTDVTTFRTTATGQIEFPITKKYFAEVSTTLGVTATNFSGDSQFIDTGKSSGDPWGDLYQFSLRFRSKYLINDTWSLLLSSWTGSRWEQGVNFDDGMRGAGATGATYNLGDKFYFSAGVAVSSKMVGNGVTVNPFGQFTWKIDERNTFSTTGLGLQLRSRWNRAITTNPDIDKGHDNHAGGCQTHALCIAWTCLTQRYMAH